MNKPKRLAKGDTIGIVSPATTCENRSELTRCIDWWEDRGFNTVVGKNVNKTRGFTSASEEERAADIHEMFSRSDVDAVFCTQGGYGSAQLFRHLDFGLIRNHPKIFTGFSDITSLHLMLNRFCGLVTFHGPGAVRFNPEELTEYTERAFFSVLTDTEPAGRVLPADDKKWLNAWGGGSAEGELTGGNLTLLCASMGTPFAPDCRGKILLLEEVDSEPWMIDHLLSHLRNAGVLDKAAGVVVGECKDCVPFKFNPGFLSDTTVEDVLAYYLEPLNVPVLHGLPLGHTKDLATLPLGCRVKVDAREKSLEITEGAVI